MTDSPRDTPGENARTLLIEFLSVSRSDGDGAFELLCAEHPADADALRTLYAEHREMQELLGVFGTGRGDSAAQEEPDGARAGDLIGDFRLLSRIASGGQGEVWEAEQCSLARRVALKLVLPYRIHERALALFAREARAGGRLAHPGIVAVYGYGEDAGRHWIAQELVEGAWTLRDFIDELRGRPEVPKDYYKAVAVFMAEIAEALQSAHGAGVIHRDVKPQNILVTTDDHPKVTDFGLARITDESAMSLSGDVVGTWLYMSPEQVMAKGKELDHRTDIFSLGVVMYEMLALVRPFDGDTAHQIARNIVHHDPQDLRKARSRIPKDLAVICGKALEKDRQARFVDMGEFAADLRRHLANQPIHAQPPTVLERCVKWARRNPAKTLVSAVGSVALAIISALALNLAEKTRDAENSAQLAEQNADEATALAQRADQEAANARRKTEDVLRLSLAQDHEDLVTKAGGLWPVQPGMVSALQEWMSAAAMLVSERSALVANRDRLRATAIPLSAAERRTQRESHVEFEALLVLQAELDSRRKALAVRRGEAEVELPEVDWSAYSDEPGMLDSIAWDFVGPVRDVRGKETLGLALVLRGQERAQVLKPDEPLPWLLDTLAWAYFGVGDDARALETSQASVQAASAEDLERWTVSSERLAGAVAEASSAQGLASEVARIEELELTAADIESRVNARRVWTFPDEPRGESRVRWWHNQVSSLVVKLDTLARPGHGLLAEDGVSVRYGWGIARRLAAAQRLEAGYAAQGEFAVRWERDMPAIHAAYPGLDMSVQVGLVPIGVDPSTQLWEFWDVLSGTEPTRDESGQLVMQEPSGLVFVLLPGDAFWMGSQSQDPDKQNYDQNSQKNEGPVHQVELSAFFLSKYEMSQGQWKTLAGWNRSLHGPDGEWFSGWVADGSGGGLLQPVTNISWEDCYQLFARFGLQLPSEAQWEYGCRGGVSSTYWSGAATKDLQGVANVADRYARSIEGAPTTWEYEEELDDGFTTTAAVHTLRPNLFGLHHVIGNVRELCLDGWGDEYHRRSYPDPVAPFEGELVRVHRGGSYNHSAFYARAASRDSCPPTLALNYIGVRPARSVRR